MIDVHLAQGSLVWWSQKCSLFGRFDQNVRFFMVEMALGQRERAKAVYRKRHANHRKQLGDTDGKEFPAHDPFLSAKSKDYPFSQLR